MSFYNVDAVIDNEYGALDNETLLSEIKKRASNPTQDIIDSLKDQAEAQRAQVEALGASKQAQEALKAAQAEQARIAAEAKAAAVAAAKARADAEAKAKADAEAKAKAAAEAAAKARADAEAKAKAEAEARAKAAAAAQAAAAQAAAAASTVSTYSSSGDSGNYSSNSGFASNYSVPSATPPQGNNASIPLTTSLVQSKPPVKTAPIDTVLTSDDLVIDEALIDLLYENIGGHEIINIARNDTINGQTVTYQPIKNLSSIQQQYNPNSVLALQNTSDKYFQNFSIKLDTKLPEEGDGAGPDQAYVYIEQSTGDLIIEFINLETDEQVEVEISLSGTIYEAEFNES